MKTVENETGLKKRIRDLRNRFKRTRDGFGILREEAAEPEPKRDLREFLEMLPIPASILDRQDWEANYFNAAFTRATGYSKENCRSRAELRQRLYPDPDYREKIETDIGHWEDDVLGKPRQVERRVTTADGSQKEFIYHAIPFARNRFLTLWFDITERKKAEDKLRESNHFIETIISSMGQGFIVHDINSRIVRWNRYMESFTGLREEDVRGKLPWEVLPGLKELGEPGILKRALGGETVEVVREYPEENGWSIYKWLGSTYSPHRDLEGRILGVVAMISDITTRMKAEEALRISEEAYRHILDSVPDSVVITSLWEGRYLYVNDSFTRLTGYQREEVLGRTAAEIGIYVDLGQRQEILEALLATGQVSNMELRHLDSRGQSFETIFSARRIRYRDQDCLVGIGKDLSEIKRSREERERLEEQLRQAQKMESIGTLAGGVAHDFNNILQVIGGYVQLLSHSAELTEESGRQIAEIDGAVQRASQLVGQLLSFSRKLEPELKILDLNGEIFQAVKMLKRMIPKMINIETDLAPDLRPIQGDSVQLEQVILNLGSNASDAMPEGGRLTIKSQNISLNNVLQAQWIGVPPGEYVLLTVADTGVGIEPELIRHIFDPFYTTKETGRGTGLGLAMAYGIITSHQGRIACTSRPGAGTTFKIYLPVAASEEPPGTYPVSQAADSASGGSETVLVIDDEENILTIAGEILTGSGYHVLTARDGESALEIYRPRAGEIDLVILDISMPGMGGRRCLEEILELNPAARVIISSGYLEEERDGAAKTPGAAGFIGKPYRLPDLLRKVRAVLDGTGD